MGTAEAYRKYKDLVSEIESKKKQMDEALASTQTSKQNIDTLYTNIQTAEKNIKTINANIESINKIVIEKHDSIIKSFDDTKAKKAEIDTIKNSVKTLLDTIKDQTDRVEDLLQKASAGRLFNTFNIRKKEFTDGARFWGFMVAISVIGLMYIAFILTKNFTALSPSFWFKLSISFPLIYWLLFSAREFTKSKRLEEEYAFKSAISLSLEAYRDLIKNESSLATHVHVVPFITDAVSKIFSSPSQTISKYPNKDDDDISITLMERAAKVFRSFIKI